MLGIISSRPWDEVKVVPSAPAWSAPCKAPAAPPSLCISTTLGTEPQMFFLPRDDQASDDSPIDEEGVIGKMAATSLSWWATYAGASLPSTVTFSLGILPPVRSSV